MKYYYVGHGSVQKCLQVFTSYCLLINDIFIKYVPFTRELKNLCKNNLKLNYGNEKKCIKCILYLNCVIITKIKFNQ